MHAQPNPTGNETEPSAPGLEERSFDDPLLDCLVLLTQHHHRPISAEALRAGLPLVQNRLTPELFVRAAARGGLSARLVKRPLRRISPLTLPAVLLLEDNQACLLLALDNHNGKVQVVQPESGTGVAEVALAELEPLYTGYVIFVRPEYRFDARAPELLGIRSRHWFWGTLARSWRIYRDVLVASFLINLFALASPLFIMNVYDRVVPNNAVETLWVLAIGVAIVYGFDLLLRALRGYFIDIAGRKSDVILSAMIFERVLGIRMMDRPVSVGAFANNLREFESVRDFITSATISTLVDLPFVVLFLVVVALIGGPIVLVPAVAIPVVLIYALFVQGPLREAVDHSMRMATQKNATLVESLTGLEAIKTLGAEGVIQRRLEQATGYMARWGVRARMLSASALNIAVLMQQLATVGTVIFGVYLIGEGEISLGGLIASVILTGRAVAPTGQVANLATRYHQARAALTSLNSIMGLPQERSTGQDFVHRPVLRGDIDLRDVNFSYPGQGERALSGINLRIRAGEKVALIGRVGSGKTTVEKLILGLYTPTDGAVRIDGIDLRQIDPADLRRNTGYVPQDTLLFYGSVRDNIRLGAPFADDREVLRVAQLSGVTDFVNQNPAGFDMMVGERGETLSGGQRQAIAIARALLLDPPILLLDEPTNSMDNTTEEQFKTRMVQVLAGKTVVLVTHRASLLNLVDRIVVMDSGRIVADGPKEQVLEALKQGKLRAAR